jgi:cold-inducible RNA-binding protein
MLELSPSSLVTQDWSFDRKTPPIVLRSLLARRVNQGTSLVINIFVGNLSYQTTQEDLLATFSQFGNVDRVNIVTDRDSGQPRGFAFVEMTELKDGQNAIAQLNGAELHGRALSVNAARPKPAGGGGRGGGFGGGGNGGGRGRW